MKISERIRKYRKENNLTQSEFASMLFVSKQAVSKWENDRGTPDVSLLPELSKILNVSIDEIMGILPEKEKLSEEKENKKRKNITKTIVIISIASLIIVLILMILITTKSVRLEQKLKKQTENYISVSLPNIEKYDYADLSSMPVVNNNYPQYIYYFIFKENNKLNELEKTIYNNGRWKKELSSEIYDTLPYYLQAYGKNSDLFLIIEKEKQTIIFIAYQEKINRLIVSEYKIG